jgi:AcrR family transcriptional regulator
MPIRVPRKRPDAYQHGDLRHALIKAGLKLLSERGVEGLSLRAAAELAGVSHAAPYRHFRDKNALVAAIAEEGFRLLTAAMRAELATCAREGVLARVRAAGQGYVAFAVAHPAHLRTIFGEASWPESGKGGGPETDAVRAAGQEAYGVLRALVVEGLDTKRLRAGDADQIALAAWSLVHGLSRLLVDGQLGPVRTDPAQVRGVTDALIRMLERGVAA